MWNKLIYLFEAVLHMGLVLGVDQVEAGLAEEFRGGESHNVDDPMVHEGELPVERVPRYKFVRAL